MSFFTFYILIRRAEFVIVAIPCAENLCLASQVYDGVMKNLEEQSPVKQKLARYAFSVAREYNENLEFGRPVSAWLTQKHKWADQIVLSKIREKLGGRLT
jgi:long-subunit acyl-CoA synthetase (AMP-forming)